MMPGIVLDILRCSLHDGPGIRSTVFLKGCPLACLWCHNPESQGRDPVLAFDAARCTHCGACAAACPNGCHSVAPARHDMDRSRCTACGRCVTACPSRALEVRGRRMTVAEVLEEVLKDRDYYAASDGGLTLSGGEPLWQADFAVALARAARSAGISVALETCGIAPVARFREIRPFVDLFLYDYKGTGADDHVAHTGVSNEPVLANLEWLYADGARIVLRCPLVPGLNDSEEHLVGIAALSRRYPRLEAIEVMPYHRMGNEKARRVGMPVRLDQPDADAAVKVEWRTRLGALGCRDVVMQ